MGKLLRLEFGHTVYDCTLCTYMYVIISFVFYQTDHILGLESLLKGNIQADDDRVGRIAVQVSGVQQTSN